MRNLRDFYFGVLEPTEFDRWLCQTVSLENVLGDDAFLHLINTDYSNQDEIDSAKHLVERVYREKFQGDLIRDRVHDTLDAMLRGATPLQAGCATLWELRLNGAQFIPAVFAGYASELERTGDEDYYRERILRDVQEFLRDVEPNSGINS